MIVSDWQKAAQILETHGFAVKISEVLAVQVADRPGGLTGILAALDGMEINIEYMYAFPYSRTDQAILIFRFSDLDRAMARLQAAGINLVTSEELLQVLAGQTEISSRRRELIDAESAAGK